MAKRAQDAAGLGAGGEESRDVLGCEEVLQLAGMGAGVVVVDAAHEPGVAGGEAWGRAKAARAARAGLARLGDGVVAPVGNELFEALDGAGEVVIDADEELGAVSVRNGGDDLLEVRENGPEEGGDRMH